MHPVGLVNTGNSCFKNAVEQVVLAAGNRALVTLYRRVAPTILNDGGQHDAHEYLTEVLDQIADRTNEESFRRNFEGEYTTTINYACGHTSERGEPFRILSLPVAGTMEDMVKVFEKSEAIPTAHCDECGRDGTARKKMSIATLPKFTIVHLQRFNNAAYKRRDKVDMPLSWTHMRGMESDYNCFGIVVHNGSTRRGHYVACVHYDGAWFLCDDEKTPAPVDVRTLLPHAYMLFYRRA